MSRAEVYCETCNLIFDTKEYARHGCLQFQSARRVGIGRAPGDRPGHPEAVRARHEVGRTAGPSAASTPSGGESGANPVVASGVGPPHLAGGSTRSWVPVHTQSEVPVRKPVDTRGLYSCPGDPARVNCNIPCVTTGRLPQTNDAAARSGVDTGRVIAPDADPGSGFQVPDAGSSSSDPGSSDPGSSSSDTGSSDTGSSDPDSDSDAGNNSDPVSDDSDSDEGVGPRRRRKRRERWATRGDHLIFPELGAERSPSVREYSFYKVESAMKGNIPRKIVDSNQKVECKIHSGFGNHNIPPSLYAMKQALNIPNAGDFKVEACSRCLHIWETELPDNNGLWTADMQEECPICLRYWTDVHGDVWRANRDKDDFVPKRLAWDVAHGRFVSTYFFYYFGLESVLKSLDGMPDWRALRLGPKHDDSDRYPWWSSAEFKRLNDVGLGGLLGDPKNGVYDLGLDHAPPFIQMDHTTLFVFLRPYDLPVEDLGTRKYHRTLAIAPGPCEQKSVQPLLKLISEDFKRYGGTKDDPPTHTITLHDKEGNAYIHRPFLRGFDADTPAQKACTESNGHSGYLPCMRCTIYGEYSEGAVRLRGYNERVANYKLPSGEEYVHKKWAKDHPRTTHEEIMTEMKKIKETGQVEGSSQFKGWCCVPFVLPYFDMLSGFRIAVYHKLVIGVLKNYVITVMDNADGEWYVGNEHKRRMRWRLKQLITNIDVDTKVVDIVEKRSSMHISHWLRFAETYAPLLFFDAFEGEETSHFWHIMQKLRRACISFLKPNSMAYSLEECQRNEFRPTADSAEKNMHDVAVLMEKYLPDKLTMTHNLHEITIHLAEQWRRSGMPPCHSGELYVERAINEKKHYLRGVTDNPEVAMVNKELTRNTLDGIRHSVRDVDKLVGVTAHAVNANYGAITDDATGQDFHFMQGGNSMAMAELHSDGFMDYIRVDEDFGGRVLVQTTKVEKFAVASVNKEVVHSQIYTRSRKKQSYHIAALFEEGLYFGSVKYFVKITFEDGMVARMARVDFYTKVARKIGGCPVVKRDQIIPGDVNKWCPLTSIKSKVIFAKIKPNDVREMVLPACKASE